MASTDSEKERHENAAVAAFEEKSQALGGYKSNFKKLKALFTNNEGNAAIQLANNLPATIADIILPEDQSGMINSFREVLVEPESTIPTSSRLEVEGQQRIIRRWSDATPQNLDKIITNFLHDPENTRMDSFWESAESVTLTDRKKLFYGSCLTVLAYIIVFNLSRVACNFVGFIYPLHASHRALKSKSRKHNQHVEWLKYWCVYSTFAVADTFIDFYLSPYGVYWLLKCLFVGYLLAPFTQGTDYVYYNYVQPVEAALDTLVELHNTWEKDSSILSDGSTSSSDNSDGARSAERLSDEGSNKPSKEQ